MPKHIKTKKFLFSVLRSGQQLFSWDLADFGKKQVYSACNFQSLLVKGDKPVREKIECSLSATMIGMKCLALTGTPHRSRVRIDQESNTFPAELSVLILFKMIGSIDMTLCVISFLVYSSLII